MTRFPRPALVAIAVVLLALPVAGTAGALGNPPGQAAVDGPGRADALVPINDTTNHLAPDGEATGPGGYARAQVDVAGAVATSAERLAGRHTRLTVSASLYDVEDADLRRVATEQLGVIDARLSSLRAEQRRLYAGSGNGTVSDSTLTRRLVHLQVAAAREATLLRSLSRDLNAIDPGVGRELETRFSNLRGEIATLESPVAGKMAAAVNASRPTFSYYVASGPDAQVLATADNTTYRREAYDGTNRDPDGTNRFAQAGAPTLAAFNRAAELYTWAFGNALRQSAQDFGTTRIYRINVEHDQGMLTLFLDGATRDVFLERQRKDLAAVPTTPSASAASTGLALTLNTTAPTGPMRVELTAAGIGAPVNGTVRIGGEIVGVTGSDGTLWTVQPAAGTAVNATAGGDSVVARP